MFDVGEHARQFAKAEKPGGEFVGLAERFALRKCVKETLRGALQVVCECAV
jgi:hypothetical protein